MLMTYCCIKERRGQLLVCSQIIPHIALLCPISQGTGFPLCCIQYFQTIKGISRHWVWAQPTDHYCTQITRDPFFTVSYVHLTQLLLAFMLLHFKGGPVVNFCKTVLILRTHFAFGAKRWECPGIDLWVQGEEVTLNQWLRWLGGSSFAQLIFQMFPEASNYCHPLMNSVWHSPLLSCSPSSLPRSTPIIF